MKIYTATYKNKAKVEIFYHKRKVKGEIDADRIQLIITPAGSKPRGWLMTALEATDIVYGLARGIGIAMEDQLPMFDKDK